MDQELSLLDSSILNQNNKTVQVSRGLYLKNIMRRNGPYCNKQSLICVCIDSRIRIHTRHLLIKSKST